MVATIEPKYYETGDVARAFGVSSEAVRKWEREGTIAAPIRTVGGRRLFSLEQVEEIRARRASRHEVVPPLDAA